MRALGVQNNFEKGSATLSNKNNSERKGKRVTQTVKEDWSERDRCLCVSVCVEKRDTHRGK